MVKNSGDTNFTANRFFTHGVVFRNLNVWPFSPISNVIMRCSAIEMLGTNHMIKTCFFANHPSVLNIDQKMKASEVEVDLTRQKYKQEWGVNASYGYRDDAQNGTDRADLFSVGITFDVPLFTGKRQDKQLAAAQSQSLSVGTEKWLLLRPMIAAFEKFKVQLLRLNERDNLYTEALLPQMHEQAEASLTAYTNNDGDFAEVIRSRIAELNSQVDALNIRIE